eukprot:CAMPEP_0118853028 /NCGR_PEP_ID=MMETSP1163-20130328/1768_1 /TAXON_ID=124430 /ORGANISM="Phaeomonas parva, Strain CCMP2877" /LENGTH=352 /DNA_ID=CAMNT_0006785509 /DNA_START=205 /DNA_END=1260 /DNA_ORIENTATION=-
MADSGGGGGGGGAGGKRTKDMTPWEFYEHIGSPKLVCAPMVNASELPFRMLTRRYGADLCYTPMFHSRLFSEDAAYRAMAFTTCPEDRPLFVQFCGNEPATLVAAGRHVQDRCDAVDLNLGCPQGIAKRGHYGSFLLEEWDLLRDIVSAMVRELDVPVTVKIRLLPRMEDTLQLCRVLLGAGAKLLTVHGRTREEKKDKVRACRWHEIAQVRAAFPDVPVFANGGIEFYGDIPRCLKATGCDGVMSSEALLENPALFADNKRLLRPAAAAAIEARRRLFAEREAQRDKDTRLTAKKCGNCGKVGVMPRACRKCHAVFYCNKKCYLKHWKSVHKEQCPGKSAACREEEARKRK